MQYRADSLGVSGSVVIILRDLIHDRLGLYYEPHQFDQVADRLAPLIVARGLGSFIDYYYLLKYADDAAEWLNVIDALAVQETYFWREIDQLRAMVDVIVPRIAASLRGEPLRIWSIPCATGEEPLTIAMLLSEAGWFSRAPIELLASDASPAAIAKARAGHYGQRSFRNLPLAMREKYFTADGEGWRVSPSLQQRIAYDVVNLAAEEQVARYGSAPVVVCRNVFIYFSPQSIRRTVSMFERSMPAPGFLCLGASESLLRHKTGFDLQEIGGAFVYVKGDASATGHTELVPDVQRAS